MKINLSSIELQNYIVYVEFTSCIHIFQQQFNDNNIVPSLQTLNYHIQKI